MHFFASWLTKCLVRNKIATDAEMDECINGFEMLFNKILVYGSMIIISIIQHKVMEASIFILFLIGLRTRTGGFHMNTHIGCLIGSVVVYLIASMGLDKLFYTYPMALYISIGISVIVLVIFAPINHPNLNLDLEEMVSCKKSTRRILILELVAIGCFVAIQTNSEVVIYAGMAIIMCAALVVLGKVFKQEINEGGN